MRLVYVLGILIPFQLSCQSLRSSLTEPRSIYERCIASAVSCESLLRPSLVEDRVELNYPPLDPFPLSPLTQQIVRNLKLLGIPFELQKYPQPDAGPIAVELTFTQFVEAYLNLPGGRELVSILGSEFSRRDEIKQALNDWVDQYIPGYTLEWEYEGESTFIEQGDFFDYLERKRIPIANHHDLLAHLFLFSDPEIRSLTERLAAIYEKAVRYDLKFPVGHPSSNFSDRVNSLWVRLQESTPVEYRDFQGLKRLAIIGGFPSVVDPLQPYTGYLLDWIYIADIEKIYVQINFEIEHNLKPEKRQEMQQLYSNSLNYLQDTLNVALSDTEQVLARIDHEFNLVSLTTPSYQERWRQFSKRVLEGPSDPSLTLLRPQVHRRLMNQTLTLIEKILESPPADH